MSTPDQTLVLFARGVIARLSYWPALTLAVENSWGGPESAQKRTWMASAIVDAFDPSENPELPDDIYVEELLLQIMADEFDTHLEDGSAEAVATDIVKLWEDVQTVNAEAAVSSLEARAQTLKGRKIVTREEIDESGEWDDTDDEEGEEGESDEADADNAPSLLAPRDEKKHEPEVDEEGFTLVKSKGRSHK